MWRLFKDQGVEGWKEGGERGGVSGAYWAPYSTLLSSGLFQERKRRGVRFFFFTLFWPSCVVVEHKTALCRTVDTLENALLPFGYLNSRCALVARPEPPQSVTPERENLEAKAQNHSTRVCQRGVTLRWLRASAAASLAEEMSHMGRHQQLIKNRRTQTNKVAANWKGVGGARRRKGRMVHRSGMFSCSPVPQTAAISTC